MRISVNAIGDIRVEGNRGMGELKNKWIEVIGEDMTACRANENMANDEEGWRERIRITYRKCVRWKGR